MKSQRFEADVIRLLYKCRWVLLGQSPQNYITLVETASRGQLLFISYMVLLPSGAKPCKKFTWTFISYTVWLPREPKRVRNLKIVPGLTRIYSLSTLTASKSNATKISNKHSIHGIFWKACIQQDFKTLHFSFLLYSQFI